MHPRSQLVTIPPCLCARTRSILPGIASWYSPRWIERRRLLECPNSRTNGGKNLTLQWTYLTLSKSGGKSRHANLNFLSVTVVHGSMSPLSQLGNHSTKFVATLPRMIDTDLPSSSQRLLTVIQINSTFVPPFWHLLHTEFSKSLDIIPPIAGASISAMARFRLKRSSRR